jgi:hypothetical protein
MFEPSIEEAILAGVIEVSGVDLESGQFLYNFNSKMSHEIPAIFEKHLQEIKVEIIYFWRKGLLDVDDLSGNNPVIMLTEQAYDEEILSALPPEKFEYFKTLRKMFEG